MAIFSGSANNDDYSYGNGGDTGPFDINDTMLGFGGNDVFSPKAGTDFVDGGFGIDTVEYFSTSDVYGLPAQGINANLAAGVVIDAWGFTDTVLNCENLVATNHADVITTNFTSAYIMALGGNDIVQGLGGYDYLDLGEGDDVGYGNSGNDTIVGGGGRDILYGQTGSDYLDAGEGDDAILGGDDNDQVLGGGGCDNLYGEAGCDTVSGDAGNDVLDGGAGADRLIGGSGNDTFYHAFGQGLHNFFTPDVIVDFAGANQGQAVGEQDFLFLDVANPATATLTLVGGGAPADLWQLDPDGAGGAGPEFIQIIGVTAATPLILGIDYGFF